MFNAEIVPLIGSGCALPPAMPSASTNSSCTIKAPCSVRVCQRLVLGALEAHPFEVVLQRAVCLGVCQNLQADHDINVHGTGMCGHKGLA